jgi:guanylate kinase
MNHLLIPKKEYKIVVIAGPTGSGESTFTNELVLTYPNLVRAVSATTRAPRGHEQDGVDYYFMNEIQFFEHVQSGDIPEHTFVPGRHVHYGAYLPDIESKLLAGKVVIVNTDVVGARYFKDHFHAVTIFIHPKSIETLRARILRRNPDIAEKELSLRIESAVKEISEAEGNYDFVVFNDDGEFVQTVEHIMDFLHTRGTI